MRIAAVGKESDGYEVLNQQTQTAAGFPLWSSQDRSDADQLEPMQNRATRSITQDCRSRDPGCVSDMLSRLNTPSLQEPRKQQRLVFMGSVVEGLVPAMPPHKFLVPGQKRMMRKEMGVTVDSTQATRVERPNSRRMSSR
ncbi:hypothetical protein ACOMHN_064457 [Nucella lapillus]